MVRSLRKTTMSFQVKSIGDSMGNIVDSRILANPGIGPPPLVARFHCGSLCENVELTLMIEHWSHTKSTAIKVGLHVRQEFLYISRRLLQSLYKWGRVACHHPHILIFSLSSPSQLVILTDIVRSLYSQQPSLLEVHMRQTRPSRKSSWWAPISQWAWPINSGIINLMYMQ